jgi:ubiquinone biosynthesis protein UbiJ
MKLDWLRLIVQSIATLAGGIGAVNLGRLTTPESAAGPWDLAGWVGLPAVAGVAAAVGQAFLRPRATTDKPGSAGHREACDSLYALARDCQWDRARRLIDAWQDMSAQAVVDAWQAKRETKP